MITDVVNKTYIMQGDYKNHTLDKYHLIFSPSYGCNMSCRHCYLPSHFNKAMDFSTVRKILLEWSEIIRLERGRMNGIFHLKGGEPLHLPYLYDIFDLLKEEKMCSLMITTNGTLGSSTFFSEIKKLDDELENSTTVIVSLDGSQDEIHGLLRGEGNFYKTIDFIRNLTKRDINIHLNYVVHRKNLFDLENFVNLAMSLDVSQINFLKFIPKGFGQSIEEWAVDNTLYNQRMIELYETASSEAKELLAGNLGYIVAQEKHGSCASCECVGGYKGLLYIVPNGDVFYCPNLIEPELRLGNVQADSLFELHENTLDQLYYRIKQYNDQRYQCKGELLRQKAIFTESQLDSHKGNISYCYSRNF